MSILICCPVFPRSNLHLVPIGSSETAQKHTDALQGLASAIEDLSGAVVQEPTTAPSEAHETLLAIRELTAAVQDMREDHKTATSRLVELQEKRLRVMEAILELKIRKRSRSTPA